MKFLDEARVHVRSGDGGAGCISFRREKFIEFGGPNGGDGGNGGDVVVLCVAGLNTLVDFRYRQHFKARSGRPGMGRNRTGAAGEDVILRVPAGVQVLDADGETVLAELDRVGQRVVLFSGGRGGFGNTRFKSSTNRAPRRANPGLPGVEQWISLRLRLIADAGLLGLPNAGKSTFLSIVSAARPKVADYPFTTKYPHLGVVGHLDQEFVLADIPGLIEGANRGVGLGCRFLSHIEKCGVLIHLVDATAEDVVENYRVIRREVSAYGHGLEDRTELVALSKCDAIDAASLRMKLHLLEDVTGKTPFAVSSVSKEGMSDLLACIVDVIESRVAPEQGRLPAAGHWTPWQASG